MSLELANAAEASQGRSSAYYIYVLRQICEVAPSKLNAEQRDVQVRVDAFIRWEDDPRPEFDTEYEGGDKFSDLIAIARKHTNCLDFLTVEVGVNGSTIWRWAKDKVRPSPYIGRQLVKDVKFHLIKSLVVASYEAALVPDDVAMSNITSMVASSATV